jgi:hypothetical protein
MGYPIKQGQTAQPLLFLMIDEADHLAGKPGLSPTVTLSKNGAAFAAPAGAVSEVANGWYKVAGNATDSGTLGPLLLHAEAAGADPCDERYDVVAYDPQSASNLGLTNLDAAVSSRSTFAGGAVSSVTGDVGGNVVGSVASVTAGVTVTTNNDKTGYGLADASITSAKFGAITPGLSGFLERLAHLCGRFFPVAGGSVTAPKSGNGNLIVKGAGGTTISTQTVADNGTTQTLGAAS